MASKTMSKAGKAGAPVTQEQLDAIMAQNRELLAQNQSLAQMVASMGVSAPTQETAKRFEPKQATVADSAELRAKLERLYGCSPARAKELVADGLAGVMHNIDVRIDEKSGRIWFGHDYTQAYGSSEAGNPTVFYGGGYKSMQISHQLANGEWLEMSYGLPPWFVHRTPKARKSK